MADLAHHLINMVVPYLQSSIPYLADTRVIMAFTAVLHIIFTSLSTKVSFSWNNRNFITIKFSDPYGPRILKYIYRNHMDKVKRIKLSTVNAKKDTIAELRKSISVPYENNTIYISIEENKCADTKSNPDTPPTSGSNTANSDNLAIMFQSYASMKIIKEFIEKIANQYDSDDITEKVIKAHYIRDRTVDKERFVHWVNVDITTNKELKYVFVSDTVQNELIDNIATFMENEQFYRTRGLPYKKSFLLHGPPGCGKTSVIKAISIQYKLPLFIFNIGSLGNKELVSLLFEINEWIKKGEKYIILLEDFDRVLEKMTNQRDYYYHNQDPNNKLTMDSILNFLDGIDESYGRLTFISANNINLITSNEALCRPGRIDHIVKLDCCDREQIKKIIVNCRNEEETDVELSEKDIDDIVAMNVSPARFINVYNTRQSVWTREKLFEKLKNTKETREGMKMSSVVNDRCERLNRNMRKHDEDIKLICSSPKELERKCKSLSKSIQLIRKIKKCKPLSEEIRDIDRQILALKKKRLVREKKKTNAYKKTNKRAKKEENKKLGQKK